MWERQCQECLHLQFDSYRNRVCKKCKSPALDYGKETVGEISPTAKLNDDLKRRN